MPHNNNYKTSIGGQALIEGIMMRGPKKQAIVVRGVVNFGSSMVNGVRALMFSADFMPEEETEPESRFDKWIEEKFSNEKAEKIIVTITVIVGIALSVGLFMLLPTFLAGFVTRFVENAVLKNLIEGVLRIAIFVAYIGLTSKLKEMARVWQYHGAEHKTIFCYERGLPLTVENVRKMPRKHPRCGTSFMFIVMIVSILVFSLARWSNVWERMGLRLLLLPVVVAISYELLKLAGRYDNRFTRILSAPGRALQNITTKEPEDDMIEVAIEALTLVLPETEGEDEW